MKTQLLDVDRDDLLGYYDVWSASYADWNDEPFGDYDTIVAAVRNPLTTFGPQLHWAAYEDGRMVGHCQLSLPSDSTVGMAKVTVHPDFRRRGIGAALLRAALPTLRSHGRTTLEGWSLTKDGPGHRWAARRGFATVHETVLQRLMIDEVDQSLWDVPDVAGYRTVSWNDRAPDDLVASYAAVQDAIQDAPLGDTGFRYARWTADRVRRAEDERRSQGIEQRVVVAVSSSTGEVVAYTEIDLRRKDRAVQLGTAVLPAHRGHGLGRLIKARMARWLRADRPDLDRVLTTTASSNVHMIDVNHRIGFTTTRTMLVVSRAVEGLDQGVDSRAAQ
ncbi:GNAT family N-acetyltransferase [Kutzneria sp. NPDC052558]|uniref:GNAT family N-acetyltransferase n=1 Tax=Kutzneria sp. NPDC052558 TaxID=3364121 RepID=UPI0037CB98D9